MKSFFLLLALFIFIACDQPQPKETAASKPKFQLEGTIQQVVSKHADGSPKVSLFLDEKTKHYMELTLILLKSEFKTILTGPHLFSKIRGKSTADILI